MTLSPRDLKEIAKKNVHEFTLNMTITIALFFQTQFGFVFGTAECESCTKGEKISPGDKQPVMVASNEKEYELVVPT